MKNKTKSKQKPRKEVIPAESSESEIEENEMEVDSEEQQVEEDDQSVEDAEEVEAGASDQEETTDKKKKKGVIYLSSIAKFMNVTILRQMLSEYAEIDRIYLQPGKLTKEELNRKKKKKRLAKHFTEGWVEFKSKRAAKRVAAMLNSKPIATRKSSKFYDILWVMKYLPRFKWVHLSERLTYENAVHRQKLQSEISQARKETTFFKDNLDRSDKLRKTKKKQKKANNGFVEADA